MHCIKNGSNALMNLIALDVAPITRFTDLKLKTSPEYETPFAKLTEPKRVDGIQRYDL